MATSLLNKVGKAAAKAKVGKAIATVAVNALPKFSSTGGSSGSSYKGSSSGSSSKSGTSKAKSTSSATTAAKQTATNALANYKPNFSVNVSAPTGNYDTSTYDKLYNEYAQKARSDADAQINRSNAGFDDQLRQAYVLRMQNQQALDDNLTNAGIRGGGTETSNLKLATNYENSRNSINAQRMQALADIESNYNDNVFNYKQANDEAKLAYIQQREAEDRARYQEELERARATRLDNLTSYYGSWYDLGALRRALAGATNAEHQAVIQNRINYLTQRNKGY